MEEEEEDNDLGQIAGCQSRNRRVAALSVGGGRPERAPREKGKRRGSWGGNTEERRRAVRGEGGGGGRQKDKCTAWSLDEVGPRRGLGREMYGARSQMTGQPRLTGWQQGHEGS